MLFNVFKFMYEGGVLFLVVLVFLGWLFENEEFNCVGGVIVYIVLDMGIGILVEK